MSRLVRIALVIVGAGLLSGCDKCGDWVKPNLPSIPKTCTGDR